MPSIQEFIASAASQIGASESATESATGAILKAFRDRADSGDFEQLLQEIPGASGLLSKGAASGNDASPLGGLLGSSALTGNLGSAAGILMLLQKSGLGSDKLSSLLPLFLEFARSQAGESLVNRVLGQAPELKTLLG